MDVPRFKVEIEVYDPKQHRWAQKRYLVHGVDDLLWTDDLQEALSMLECQIRDHDHVPA